MFSKLIAIDEQIEVALGDILLPAQYKNLVFKKTREVLEPKLLELYSSHHTHWLLAQVAPAREKVLFADILLIEQSLTNLQDAMITLKTELTTTTLGGICFNLIKKVLAGLALLKGTTIVEATADSVNQLEVHMAELLSTPQKNIKAINIAETQATLKRLGILDYNKLSPPAKTLVLLRGFILGILFQNINGLEGMQHENCIELVDCKNEQYYSKLLPSMLGNSILFHESLEKSLRLLMAWVEQDYLLGQPQPR